MEKLVKIGVNIEREMLEDIDSALKKDREEADGQLKGDSTESRLKSLPIILRSLGALVLIAAAATFMLQQWGTMDHIMRYFAFLGFTLTLCGAGFFCGLKIKEDKGARTFLAVTAAIVPVHFCQLGALIYSKSGVVTKVPELLTWVAPDMMTALITTGVGILALIPITLIAFSALARSNAREITAVYLLTNGMLLLPTRLPGHIGVIALLTFLAIMYFDQIVLANEASLKTDEGILSKVLLYVPVVLILGRTVNLYNVDQLFFAAINGIVAIGLFVSSARMLKDKANATVVQGFSVVPAMLSIVCLIDTLMINFCVSREYLIPFMCLPLTATLFVMSYYSIGTGVAYRRVGTFVAISGLTLQLVLYPGIFSSSLCIFAGLIGTAYGFTIENKATFLIGLLGLILGLGYHLQEAIKLATFSPWVSLAVLGIVTVIASSYIERNYREILQRVKIAKLKMASWS